MRLRPSAPQVGDVQSTLGWVCALGNFSVLVIDTVKCQLYAVHRHVSF